MFKPGEKIKMHDGSVVKVRRRGARLPKGPAMEAGQIRGFVRGALVDCVTGEEKRGDWHENVITTYGHGQVIRNFVGLAGSSFASFWQVGHHTDASSNFSTRSALQTVYGLIDGGASSVSRATVSVGSQNLSGTWTLYQSFQYASSHLPQTSCTVGAIAQAGHAHISSGSMYSVATFDSSVKSSTQALNISYHWLFST